MRYDRTVRIFHLIIMITVLAQLLTEQLMKVPKPGEAIQPFEALLFGIHEWNGFVILALVAAYIMYLTDDKDDWKRLFPWTSASGCKGLWQEIRLDVPGWLKGRLKRPADAHHIAGTVHGLSILLAIGLGSTGIMIFMGLESDGSMSPEIKLLRDLHSKMGTLMWIYMFGHTGMALMHQLSGHRILQDIFSLKDDGFDR
ncbi:MAG: cytochrome b/b6 domain-containing protein [Mariprofundaceae bacterium]